MPTSATVQALQQAAEGLTYQSETDAPWKAFAWPGAEGEPAGAAVRQRGRHKPDAPVAEQSVEEFFAPPVQDRDWYGDEERGHGGEVPGAAGRGEALPEKPNGSACRPTQADGVFRRGGGRRRLCRACLTGDYPTETGARFYHLALRNRAGAGNGRSYELVTAAATQRKG